MWTDLPNGETKRKSATALAKNEETVIRTESVRKLLVGERKTPCPMGSRRANHSIWKDELYQKLNGDDPSLLLPWGGNDLNQRGDTYGKMAEEHVPTDKCFAKLPSTRALVTGALNSPRRGRSGFSGWRHLVPQ